MRVLVDTCALLWHLVGSDRLSERARQAIDGRSGEGFVSVVSLWEIAIKRKLGKLDLLGGLTLEEVFRSIDESPLILLPLTPGHLLRFDELGAPEPRHKDPFDRILVAQSRAEGLTLLSIDAKLDHYGVPRVR